MRLAAKSDFQGATPVALIGDLRIDAVGLQETAEAFVDYCRSAERQTASRPIFSTSVNGQVVSLCDADHKIAALFLEADSINADGQPLVILSRILCKNPLPE